MESIILVLAGLATGWASAKLERNYSLAPGTIMLSVLLLTVVVLFIW